MKAVGSGAALTLLEGCSRQEPTQYKEFSFPGEVDTILYTAKRVGVEPEHLLAIREAEKGRDGLQFGIMHTEAYRRDNMVDFNVKNPRPYKSSLEKQASWAAGTVRRNIKRWNSLSEEERSGHRDFIDFLGDKYAPVGADNDPSNLNTNWERNVRFFYEKFCSD